MGPVEEPLRSLRPASSRQDAREPAERRYGVGLDFQGAREVGFGASEILAMEIREAAESFGLGGLGAGELSRSSIEAR